MIKFSKEEVSLCKQIAEKWRKKNLERGDWYLLKLLSGGEQIRLHDEIKPWILLTKDYIPLWTISDCLEFLREKKEVIELWRAGRGSNWICRIKSQKWWKGNTPLEACLKAVLAVLEEKK